jgi:hypothetical protein
MSCLNPSHLTGAGGTFSVMGEAARRQPKLKEPRVKNMHMNQTVRSEKMGVGMAFAIGKHPPSFMSLTVRTL